MPQWELDIALFQDGRGNLICGHDAGIYVVNLVERSELEWDGEIRDESEWEILE